MTEAEMEAVFSQVFDQGTPQSIRYMCDTWNEMTDADKQASGQAKTMNWKLRQLGQPKVTTEEASQILDHNCAVD